MAEQAKKADEFETALTDFLEQIRDRSLSDATVDNYGRDLHTFFAFCREQGCRSLAQLDSGYITSFLASRRRQGKASSTISRQSSAIRGFCRFLQSEQRQETDISQNLSTPKLNRPLPDVLTSEEIEKLLALPDLTTPLGLRDRAILELLYGCGLRVSEAASITFYDIFVDEQLLRCLGKGDKERIIPIGSYALQAISDYLRYARPTLLRQKDTQELFVNHLGGKLSRSGIWRIIRGYGDKLGFDIHPHTLRHSAATHMLENGADLRIVQEFLGHESINTTEIYTHLDKTRQSAVYFQYHPRARRGGRKESQ